MTLKFSEIIGLTGGEVLQFQSNANLDKLLIDSRQLVSPSGALFFALTGPRYNGHDFISQVYGAGVRNFVVSQADEDKIKSLPEANILKVEGTLKALQQVAAYHRSQFRIPVIGITGSNGKTIIKEWIYQLLGNRKAIKNPKSYNSQVGVPLSVWQLTEDAEIGIFEAGISKPDEMENLQKIIQPTLGLFTNIGTAHDSGFSNRSQKIQEKAKLFTKVEKVIYCRDHDEVHQILKKQLTPDQLFCWSTTQQANLRFTLESTENYLYCSWDTSDQQEKVLVPFSDPASLENLLHCLALLIYLGHSQKEISCRINELQSITHRLSLVKGMDQCYIVDDTYNNDLAGLEVALDFLNQHPHGKEKVVILSDIKQAADDPRQLYDRVAQLITTKGVDRFYGIGPNISGFSALFSQPGDFYLNTDRFLSEEINFKNQSILVKGAREFEFERIVEQLQEKHHGTVLEIDLGALTDNLNYFKSLLPDDTKIMVMVKAFAYGSGSQEVAHLLQYQGVDYLGVAYADEGINLRRNGIHIPIMVMNPSIDSYEKMVEYRLEPEIYSLKMLKSFQHFCKQNQQVTPIHLKIDTGMHRLGFEPSQFSDLIKQMEQFPLKVSSIFSHLAAADDPSQDDFTKAQFNKFVQTCEKLETILSTDSLRHILNTSGIINYSQYHLDMVRLGIGLYGVGPSGSQLKNISVLKTTISQIKNIRKGETIGYGRSGVADTDRTIATIAIGYADGFDRRNGNGVGKVLVGDRLAPVIGNICMDMSMIDITDCQAQVGDQVIIFNDKLTLSAFAANIGTIPYEVLTSIGERVKRVYYSR